MAADGNVRNLKDAQSVIPEFDGQRVDRIRVYVTGSVELDPSDVKDRAAFLKLKLGEEVELSVTGTVTARPHKVSNDRDGYIKSVFSDASLRVHSLSLPSIKSRREAARFAGPEENPL